MSSTPGVLAVAVLVTAWLAAAPRADAAAAAARCRPIDGLRTSAVVRRERPAGSDVTEFFANGGYRVTRCTTSGQILGTQEDEPIEVPGGGRALLPVSTFTSRTSGPEAGTVVTGEFADPTDPVFRAAWAAAGAGMRSSRWAPGAALSGAVARAARSRAVRVHARAGAVGDSCRNGEYHWEGPTLAFGRYAYRVNPRRLPHGAADITQIINGHTTFRDTRNDCGFADVTAVVPTYAGTTSATAHSAAAPDGVNAIDFGPMANIGCSPLFVACTIYSFANGVNFSDIDTRFNASMAFSTVGGARSYDLWSTAAHETGHAVGLAHATSSRYLTMYPQATLGATWKRTLARGDAIGFRCRYGIRAGGC